MVLCYFSVPEGCGCGCFHDDSIPYDKPLITLLATVVNSAISLSSPFGRAHDPRVKMSFLSIFPTDLDGDFFVLL